MALLDSGAESSLLGVNYADSFFPGWKDFEDAPHQVKFGVGVDGTEFTFYGTKMFQVKVGNIEARVPFSIPKRGTDLLFGLDLLKVFKIKMIFK